MKKFEVPKINKNTLSNYAKMDTRKFKPDYVIPKLIEKIMQMLGNAPHHIGNAYQKSKGANSGWTKIKVWIAKEMMK